MESEVIQEPDAITKYALIVAEVDGKELSQMLFARTRGMTFTCPKNGFVTMYLKSKDSKVVDKNVLKKKADFFKNGFYRDLEDVDLKIYVRLIESRGGETVLIVATGKISDPKSHEDMERYTKDALKDFQALA